VEAGLLLYEGCFQGDKKHVEEEENKYRVLFVTRREKTWKQVTPSEIEDEPWDPVLGADGKAIVIDTPPAPKSAPVSIVTCRSRTERGLGPTALYRMTLPSQPRALAPPLRKESGS
jgi:hypothetical protein